MPIWFRVWVFRRGKDLSITPAWRMVISIFLWARIANGNKTNVFDGELMKKRCLTDQISVQYMVFAEFVCVKQ